MGSSPFGPPLGNLNVDSEIASYREHYGDEHCRLCHAACAKNHLGTVAEYPQLSTLKKLINDAGLTETLKETGPYTLFAPTNDAFKAVPAKTLDGLAKDRAALISLMSYHVLQGKIETTQFKEGPTKTVQGASVEMYRAGPYVTVGESMVTVADVEASNGVVQIIDRVLVPPTKK